MAFLHFQELDDHINNVATKVVHLGDQLEGVNTPRARAEEAKRLIEYFSEFLDDFGPKAEVFNDPFQVPVLDSHTLSLVTFRTVISPEILHCLCILFVL